MAKQPISTQNVFIGVRPFNPTPQLRFTPPSQIDELSRCLTTLIKPGEIPGFIFLFQKSLGHLQYQTITP